MSLSPVTTGVLVGTVTTVGQWSEGKDLSPRFFVAGVVLAIGLTLLEDISPELGTAFGILVLLAVMMRYGLSISDKLGLAKK